VWWVVCMPDRNSGGHRLLWIFTRPGIFFLIYRMPAPQLEGQFDDAPIDKLPEDFRQRYSYIDDTSPELSDDISEGDGDFDFEELDDDFARVEDEDWEIAERGGCSNPTLQILSFFDSPS